MNNIISTILSGLFIIINIGDLKSQEKIDQKNNSQQILKIASTYLECAKVGNYVPMQQFASDETKNYIASAKTNPTLALKFENILIRYPVTREVFTRDSKGKKIPLDWYINRITHKENNSYEIILTGYSYMMNTSVQANAEWKSGRYVLTGW